MGDRSKAWEGEQPDDLIFTSPEGGKLRLSNWRKTVFNPACKAASLTGFKPHDLRHTAASLLSSRVPM